MQTLITAGIIVLATGYVGRAMLRTLRSALGTGGGCASGCGKCSASAAVTPESERRVALPLAK